MKLAAIILTIIGLLLLPALVSACDQRSSGSSSSSIVNNNNVVVGGGSGGSGTGTKFTIQGRKGKFVAGSIADGQAGQIRSRKKRTRINVGP